MAFQRRDAQLIVVTPTVDTNAYASGDQLSTAQRLLAVAEDTKGLALLRSILVIDADNQKAGLDLLFFNQDPGVLAADNAPVVLSTAQLAMLVGKVAIVTGDYAVIQATTNAVAYKEVQELLGCLKGLKDLWLVIVIRGSATYTAAGTSLVIKLVMEKL